MRKLVIILMGLLLTMSVIKPGLAATGLASYYAYPFHGRTMANGKPFNMYAMTAAHRHLPFGTKLEVCYKRCAVVTITDRGPYVGKRELDLSLAAAKAIGSYDKGVAKIEFHFLHKKNKEIIHYSFSKDILEIEYIINYYVHLQEWECCDSLTAGWE